MDLKGNFWRRSTNHVKERMKEVEEKEVADSKAKVEKEEDIKLSLLRNLTSRRSSRIRKPVYPYIHYVIFRGSFSFSFPFEMGMLGIVLFFLSIVCLFFPLVCMRACLLIDLLISY